MIRRALYLLGALLLGSGSALAQSGQPFAGSCLTLGTTQICGSGTSIAGMTNIGITSAGNLNWNSDLYLFRDAANTLAQRNGANAQAFNVYNTYTDAGNYERLSFHMPFANEFGIYTQAAGTGTLRPLHLNASQINLRIGGGTAWTIATTGHFLAGADNTYDIGASGATRPRNLYVAGTGTFGSTLTASGLTSLGSGGADVNLGGGVAYLVRASSAFNMYNAGSIGWTSTSTGNAAADVSLFRDAAGILALRNGTASQIDRVYHSWTDASNGSWAFIDPGTTTANLLSIGSRSNGTGAGYFTKFQVEVDGVNKLDYGVTNASSWTATSAMVFPNIYGTNYYMSAGNGAHISAGSTSADILFRNVGDTTFGLLQFGGTTSSFPALKRSTTTLQFRLADDSADASFSAASAVLSGSGMIGSATALTLATGELGFAKITASGSAPGAAGAKEAWVCGTNAGSAKKIAYAGTSATPVTVVDNVGSGVTGC